VAIFEAESPHFKSENGEIWGECSTLDTLPGLNFVKKSLRRDLSLRGNFYQ